MNMRLEVLVSDSEEVRMLEFPVKFHALIIEAHEFKNISSISYPEGMHYMAVS